MLGVCSKSCSVQISKNSLDSFYVNGNIMTYFDSFGVEHISKESKKLKRNKNIKIYRIQAHDSVMCGYFYIDLLILCLKVKT